MSLTYQMPILYRETPFSGSTNYTGLDAYYTKIGDVTLTDRLTNQSRTVSHLDVSHLDIDILEKHYLEMCARSVLARRLEVIDFFRGLVHPVEWRCEPPRIILYGSKYAPRIVEGVNRLASVTKVEPVTDDWYEFRGIPDDFNESNAWVMKNIGRRYSEYRMAADIRGWRTYSEEEHFIVEHGWTLLSRVDWKMLGVLIWGESK